MDAAIANVSITAERERLMDFSQPIFDSGVQVMMRADDSAGLSMLKALFIRQIGLAVMAALVLLFGGGMLMWMFERHKQPYFDRKACDAAFPAFWWALNLVVNGGLEERMPQLWWPFLCCDPCGVEPVHRVDFCGADYGGADDQCVPEQH